MPDSFHNSAKCSEQPSNISTTVGAAQLSRKINFDEILNFQQNCFFNIQFHIYYSLSGLRREEDGVGRHPKRTWNVVRRSPRHSTTKLKFKVEKDVRKPLLWFAQINHTTSNYQRHNDFLINVKLMNLKNFNAVQGSDPTDNKTGSDLQKTP